MISYYFLVLQEISLFPRIPKSGIYSLLHERKSRFAYHWGTAEGECRNIKILLVLISPGEGKRIGIMLCVLGVHDLTGC